MTKISRRVLRKGQEEEMYRVLTDSLTMLGNPSEVMNFIDDILSPTEKVMIAKRLFVAILLARGLTYEAIGEVLKVSPTTIYAVNHNLKCGKDGYMNVINKIIRHEKVEAFLDNIEELLLKMFPKKYGSLAFLSKQQEGKELYQRRRKRLFIK